MNKDQFQQVLIRLNIITIVINVITWIVIAMK